jgi:hypothetical protein
MNKYEVMVDTVLGKVSIVANKPIIEDGILNFYDKDQSIVASFKYWVYYTLVMEQDNA